MKGLYGALIVAAFWSASATGQNKELKATQTWDVSQGIAQPESTFYHAGSDTIFVSNVAGEPLKKDGIGWITAISPDGKVKTAKWFDGLNAPKGLAESKGILWVSDIDRVVGIDIKTAKLKQTIEISGAKFLNDIVVGRDGAIFVSDTSANTIYKIKDGKPEVFVSGGEWEAPNGLGIYSGRLIVAGWGTGVDDNLGTKGPGSIYSINLTSKVRTSLSNPIGHLDGFELGWKGLDGFLVSDWIAGKVYAVHKSQWTPLIEGLKGAADIGTIPSKALLLVPEMGASHVRAYNISWQTKEEKNK